MQAFGPRPAEIAEKYWARIAKEPTRRGLGADDTVYVPRDHVHQRFSASDSGGARA